MRSRAPSLYVVDASLHVVLVGTSPTDLSEPRIGESRLPAALGRRFLKLLATHDFDREPIARATTSAIALRCVRSAGPAGWYYMLMARPLRVTVTAIA